MKKIVFVISFILVSIASLVIYFVTQSNKVDISSKENLSKYLGIDFNDQIKIDNIIWNNTDKGGTVVYLKVRVDKNYAKGVPYFRDNNKIDRLNLYGNIEKILRSAGFNIDKIQYDNTIYKEISDKKFFETTDKPYNVDIYAVSGQQSESFLEFVIHTIVPSKLNIKKEKLIS